jgi:ABC-type ATPase involved in cell division
VGVKKRVVIARSLVNQPRLILADSPLEGLDDQAQEEFLYICTKLSQVGYPIVMTSSYMLPFEIAALRCVELAGEKK